MTAAAGRRLGLGLMLGSVLLSAAGQLCMKAGMQQLHAAGSGPAALLDTALSGPIGWTLVGLLAYVLSLVSWLAVLVRYPLSLAYPMLSLSYVLVYLGAVSWPLLAETPTTSRTLGTLLILAGVGLVSRTKRE